MSRRRCSISSRELERGALPSAARWWWSEVWRWRSVATLIFSSLSSPASSALAGAEDFQADSALRRAARWRSSSCSRLLQRFRLRARRASFACFAWRASLLAAFPFEVLLLASRSPARSRSSIASWPRSVETCMRGVLLFLAGFLERACAASISRGEIGAALSELLRAACELLRPPPPARGSGFCARSTRVRRLAGGAAVEDAVPA